MLSLTILVVSRNARGRYNVTTFPEIVLDGSDYRGSRPTFFIVHGFSSDGNATWLSDLKDALLEKVRQRKVPTARIKTRSSSISVGRPDSAGGSGNQVARHTYRLEGRQLVCKYAMCTTSPPPPPERHPRMQCVVPRTTPRNTHLLAGGRQRDPGGLGQGSQRRHLPASRFQHTDSRRRAR